MLWLEMKTLGKTLAVMSVFSLPLLLFAADPTKENTAERFLEERERQEQLEQLQRRADLTPQTTLEQAEADDVCLTVKAIRLDNNTLLDNTYVRDVFRRYLLNCMGKNKVNQLIAELTNAYVEQGYITTRVYLPKQNIKATQQLHLVAIEGQIEAVEINDNNSSDLARLFMAMPVASSQVLKLPEIEQGLDQLNRVQSANATVRFEPGSEAGASKVVFTTQPKNEIRGLMGYDNNGSEGTGQDRARIGLEYDNLLNLNDDWSLFYIGSLDTNALAFNFGIPFRYWTFGLSYSYSEFLSPLTPTSELFGQSGTGTFRTEYLLNRTSKSQLKSSASLTIRSSRRFINDVQLTPQKFSNIRLGLNYSYQGTGLWLLDGGLGHGIDAFGSQSDPGDIAPDQPRAEFWKLDGGITYLGNLSNTFSLSSSLRGQFAFHTLFSSEQIHIGDRSTVRGFTATPATGDSGAYWRNDIKLRINPEWLGLSPEHQTLRKLQPYWFADIGTVHLRHPSENVMLAGGGIGLRYSGRWLTFDMSLARGYVIDGKGIPEETKFYTNFTVAPF